MICDTRYHSVSRYLSVWRYCNMKTLLLVVIYSLGYVKAANPRFRFTMSDYRTIMNTAAFVDKTLMIEKVVYSPEVILITAPPRFGKSTNLDMIKRFLEIEVNEDGSLKTKANLTTEPVTDTDNYKLFVDRDLKITANETLMEGYFGKMPVLSVDMRCHNVVRTFDDAVEFCKQVIHNTYKQHRYLLESSQLTSHHKYMIERWCNESTYRELSRHHITHGLRVLTVHLYKHFGKRRVFVIIDEHDSIIGKAMFDVKGAEVLRKIISLSVSMMSMAVKNNDIYVSGGVISGISDIPVFGFSDLDNVKTYRFLEQHDFIDYYGLTESEVTMLFNKTEFNLDPQRLDEAHEAYNGYQSERGRKVYNMFSVLKFLKTGKIQSYWTKFGTIKKFRNVFKIPAFKPYIEKLVEGKSISIAILAKLSVEDVIDLRNLLLQPQSKINYWPSTLFNYLMKEGYLTYMPRIRKSQGISVKQSTVRIPNLEVREFFARLKL